MMNKRIIRPVCALFVLLGCGTEVDRQSHQESQTSEIRRNMDSVYLLIDYATDHVDTLAAVISREDSLNVLDLLRELTTRDSISISVADYPFGVMVEQIGECRNGAGGYWIYTVNSEAIPKAASAYVVQPGDTVRFFFK